MTESRDNMRLSSEHLSRKKNLAATCIQSTWKLYRFKKENADTIEWGDWFKTQKFRRYEHKMAEDIRKWRFVRRSWSRGRLTTTYKRRPATVEILLSDALINSCYSLVNILHL